VLAEESGVHTIQGGGEPLDDAGQPGDDLGKLLDHPPAAQLRGVVRDRLEPQHAFAFGVGLAGQPPEVQLEHGQVKRRCLDRGLDDRGMLAGAARTLRGAEDGADLGHVESGAGPVHHGVEDPLHLVPVGEDQVAAVLELVDGETVDEAAFLLLVEVEPEAQARRIDPGYRPGSAALQPHPATRHLRSGPGPPGRRPP